MSQFLVGCDLGQHVGLLVPISQSTVSQGHHDAITHRNVVFVEI